MSSQGSRSGLAYVVETAYGTTPATPTLKYLPFKSHDLQLSKVAIEGNDIRPDRMPRHLRHGTKSVTGSIEADLRKEDFDALLESALLGSFTTNVLKASTTQKFLTIEDSALDIGQYRAFKGMSVNSMTISMSPDNNVSARFDMLGRDMTQSSTSVAGSLPTDDSDNEPFDTFSGVVTEGGTTIAYVTSLEFTVANGLQNVPVIGSALSYEAEFGLSVVTGTMTVRYVDSTLINKFINETPSSLTVQVNDRTALNPYTFAFPTIKYTGASVPVANPQGRIVTLPFTSIYNETENTNIKITRTSP